MQCRAKLSNQCVIFPLSLKYSAYTYSRFLSTCASLLFLCLMCAHGFVCTQTRPKNLFTSSTLSTGDSRFQFDTSIYCGYFERRREHLTTLHILVGHFCRGVVQRVAPWNFVRACTLAFCQTPILGIVSRDVIRTVFILQLQRTHTNT